MAVTPTRQPVAPASLRRAVPGTLYIPHSRTNPATLRSPTTIYSDVVAQTPVTVAVADVYGNQAPDGTNVSMITAAALKGTTPEPTSGGTATFNDLVVATIGTYQLTAQVGNQSTHEHHLRGRPQSRGLRHEEQLQLSRRPTGSSRPGRTITSASGTTFQGGVVLESSFVADPRPMRGFTPIPGTLGNGVKVRSSGNLTTSKPTFTITYTVPKATLKAADLDNLGASQFDLCLGAKSLDGSAEAWTDASGNPAVLDPDRLLLGNRPGCLELAPRNNPYIASQHKDGAGNLVIVLVKPYPWDGWGYVSADDE